MGGVAGLRRRDAPVGIAKRGGFATRFIDRWETDRSEVGVSRSLYASGKALCPVTKLMRGVGSIWWDSESTPPLFGPSDLGGGGLESPPNGMRAQIVSRSVDLRCAH